MKIEEYIDCIIDNNLEHSHWFMTKQTMSDYYFPYFIASIVETFPAKHSSGQNYQRFYTAEFNNDPEALALYPTQAESENTYRNTIITEFLGLVENDKRQYAKAHVTPAYLKLKEYIKKYDDVENFREIVDHQIEKICLNVIQSAKYDDVRDVTIFPVPFLYRIMMELYHIYGDSKLTYDEFSIFVMRSKRYQEYPEVVDLICQYRKNTLDYSYRMKVKSILEHQSTKNVRFNALFGSLTHIDYEPWDYYRIQSDNKSYQYVKAIVSMYEKSDISRETDKGKLADFMRSKFFFKGEFDNVSLETTLEPEEFKQLVEIEDDFLAKIRKLAEKYGEDGTTTALNTVRLSSVQRAFRDKLIEMQGQKCILCDATNKELLIASHIKPASVCNIDEKADYQNGLLLCAIHDKLFDKYLITFNFYDGKMQISPALTDKEKELFHLNESVKLPKELLTPERIKYLMWHNDEFWKKEENKK